MSRCGACRSAIAAPHRPVRCGWSNVFSEERPGPDPIASSSVIPCGIFNIQHGFHRFPFDRDHVLCHCLAQQLKEERGDIRPPFGGLHYVGLHEII